MADAPDLGSFPVGVIAYCLDLTPRRVQQLADEGHFPRAGRGAYPLAEVVRAYVGLLRSEIDRAPSTPDEKEAKARKTTAEAGLAEIELAKARGEVAEIAVLIEAVTVEFSVVHERMVSVPGRMAGVLTPEHAALLEDEINEAMKELSSADAIVAEAARRAAADQEGEDGPEAEAPAEPRGVGGGVPADPAGPKRKPRKVANKGAAGGVRSNARGH